MLGLVILALAAGISQSQMCYNMDAKMYWKPPGGKGTWTVGRYDPSKGYGRATWTLTCGEGSIVFFGNKPSNPPQKTTKAECKPLNPPLSFQSIQYIYQREDGSEEPNNVAAPYCGPEPLCKADASNAKGSIESAKVGENGTITCKLPGEELDPSVSIPKCAYDATAETLASFKPIVDYTKLCQKFCPAVTVAGGKTIPKSKDGIVDISCNNTGKYVAVVGKKGGAADNKQITSKKLTCADGKWDYAEPSCKRCQLNPSTDFTTPAQTVEPILKTVGTLVDVQCKNIGITFNTGGPINPNNSVKLLCKESGWFDEPGDREVTGICGT